MPDDFANSLQMLVAKELPQARKDPERFAAMVERLIACAGLAIAVGCRGDAKAIETMLQGMEAYLCESAAQNAGLGELVGMFKGRARTEGG